MSVAIITGSAGLVGSEAVRHFAAPGFEVVGIDNDMRRRFFGEVASTRWQRERLSEALPSAYRHVDADIRDAEPLEKVFARYGQAIRLVVHTAAHPSHDWAAGEPQPDFGVNADGTLNLLDATRRRCPEAVFITVSTSKVYGDRPNSLPLRETKPR
jgi:CDP-paratose 2-epimerase